MNCIENIDSPMFIKFYNRLNIGYLFILLLLSYLSYIVANLFFAMSISVFLKVSLIVIIALIFIRLAFSLSLENLIALIVLLLPFPVFLNIGGKDLGDTNTIVIYVIFMVYAMKKIIQKENILPERPLLFAISCILAFYIISFVNTPEYAINSAMRKTSIVISCILIFYMIVNTINTKSALFKLIDMLTIICFIEGLIVLLQLIFPDMADFLKFFGTSDFDDVNMKFIGGTAEGKRISTTFGFDYGTAAYYFAVNLIIQFFWIQRLKKSRKKKFYFACMFLTIIGLIASGSRLGVITLFSGLVVTLILNRKKIKLVRHLVLLCFFCAFFFIVMTHFSDYVPNVASVSSRFVNAEKMREGGGSIVDILNRKHAWDNIIPIIKEHPWIGHGPYDIVRLKIYLFSIDPYAAALIFDPHSMYFTYMFSIGILGTISVIYFFAGVLWYGFKGKNSLDFDIAYSSSVLLGTIIAFLICQIMTEYLRHSNIQQFFWILFALLVSVARIPINESSEGPKSVLMKQRS